MNEVDDTWPWSAPGSNEKQKSEEPAGSNSDKDGDIGGLWMITTGKKAQRWQKKWQPVSNNDKPNRFQGLETVDEDEECEGDIDNLEFGKWENMEELRITIDSGAVDTAGPKGIANLFKLLETEASRNGGFYRAANNSKIEIVWDHTSSACGCRDPN